MRFTKLEPEASASRNGAAPWLTSFGDMMTCILTFFILLCSLATERKPGNVAAGIGSFIQRLDALGLPGLMPDKRQSRQQLLELEQKFNKVTHPIETGQRSDGGIEQPEAFRRAATRGERPSARNLIPEAAIFLGESAAMTATSARRLAQLVPVLEARSDRVYVETSMADPTHASHRRLAIRRAEVVREKLLAGGLASERVAIRIVTHSLGADFPQSGYTVSLRLEPK